MYLNEWNIQLFLQLTGGTCKVFYGYTFVFHGFALYRYINFLFILKNLFLGTYGAVFYEHYSINEIHLLNIILGGLNIFFYIMFVLQVFTQTSYKYKNIHGRFTTINKVRLSLYP